jgi:PBP1b-binding outer membrane lipoprotein LpoB
MLATAKTQLRMLAEEAMSTKLSRWPTIFLWASVLAACSKSPVDSTVDAANAGAKQLMAPLVQKDASRQVEGLVHTIAERPDCEDYIKRLRDAGHGSPYEGATQLVIAHTYEAAGKAGCVKEH